jgi:integrase
MTITVIAKKKKKSDNFVYVSVRYFNGNGKKKVISLGHKIKEIDFNDYYSPDFRAFAPNKLFNYKLLNKLITEKINDTTIFDVAPTPTPIPTSTNEKSFIDFTEKYLKIIPNKNTRDSYSAGLTKIKEFGEFKGHDDILFVQIDSFFVIEFKNFLLTKVTPNTARQYLTVVKTILNYAKREGLYTEKYNYFSKLNIPISYSNKKILSENDIKTLLSKNKFDKYFYTRNMLLLSLLCSGLRVSDLFLLKNKDFKENYIEILTKKTSLNMRIPYNDKLIGLVVDIYDITDLTLPMGHGYYGAIETLDNLDLLKSKNNTYNKKHLMRHIATLPPEDYLFKDFMSKEKTLVGYDKLKDETDEQHEALTRLRSTYNYSLKCLNKYYNLDIEILSSHSGRYSWTNLLLNIDSVNLVDIKRSLGHKKLSTTENYIERNFGLEKMENLGKKLSDLFNE